ncbi:MAG TPA: SRPBCC family protein [Acidimicrobiales bacterium]|nr:SRPBCC family protein [Acidimicrobiales bacterium]
MAEQVIERQVTTSGGPEAVYALLADGSTWPGWSPIDSFELIEPGDGTPEGLGAVRLFVTGRHRSRERVVERRPGESFAYVLEKGLALRGYRAVVTLRPAEGGGATISWRSTFRPKVPGTGWVYRRELGRFIGEMVDGLARATSTSTSTSRAPLP